MATGPANPRTSPHSSSTAPRRSTSSSSSNATVTAVAVAGPIPTTRREEGSIARASTLVPIATIYKPRPVTMAAMRRRLCRLYPCPCHRLQGMGRTQRHTMLLRDPVALSIAPHLCLLLGPQSTLDGGAGPAPAPAPSLGEGNKQVQISIISMPLTLSLRQPRIQPRGRSNGKGKGKGKGDIRAACPSQDPPSTPIQRHGLPAACKTGSQTDIHTDGQTDSLS